MNISPEREQIIHTLHMLGPSSPKAITEAVGGSPGATRKLLHTMVEDRQIVTQKRGLYYIPSHDVAENVTADVTDEANVTGDVTDDVTNPEPVVTPEVVGKEVIPAKQPLWSPDDGKLGVYSEADGGTIPHSEMQRRKAKSHRSGPGGWTE